MLGGKGLAGDPEADDGRLWRCRGNVGSKVVVDDVERSEAILPGVWITVAAGDRHEALPITLKRWRREKRGSRRGVAEQQGSAEESM